VKLRDYIMTLAHQPLALHKPALQSFGQEYGDSTLEHMIEAAAVRANPRAAGAVAVVPLIGIIQQREDIWTRLGLATSTERFIANMQMAVADPNIKAIIVDVDSPGGTVSGTPEASDALFQMRGQKPMVGISNTLNASAAYFITSALDEVIAAPSSYTGSIGVWTLLFDETEFWASMGIKIDMVKAGKWKALGNPYEPITAEVRERFQDSINDAYEVFIKAVARNRGVKITDVRSGYGEGDVLNAERARAAGLVDRVATLSETLARFGAAPQSPGTPARAEAQRDLARARFVEDVA